MLKTMLYLFCCTREANFRTRKRFDSSLKNYTFYSKFILPKINLLLPPHYYYIVFNEKSEVAKQLRSFHFYRKALLKNHKYVFLIPQTDILPYKEEI